MRERCLVQCGADERGRIRMIYFRGRAEWHSALPAFGLFGMDAGLMGMFAAAVQGGDAFEPEEHQEAQRHDRHDGRHVAAEIEQRISRAWASWGQAFTHSSSWQLRIYRNGIAAQ